MVVHDAVATRGASIPRSPVSSPASGSSCPSNRSQRAHDPGPTPGENAGNCTAAVSTRSSCGCGTATNRRQASSPNDRPEAATPEFVPLDVRVSRRCLRAVVAARRQHGSADPPRPCRRTHQVLDATGVVPLPSPPAGAIEALAPHLPALGASSLLRVLAGAAGFRPRSSTSPGGARACRSAERANAQPTAVPTSCDAAGVSPPGACGWRAHLVTKPPGSSRPRHPPGFVPPSPSRAIRRRRVLARVVRLPSGTTRRTTTPIRRGRLAHCRWSRCAR